MKIIKQRKIAAVAIILALIFTGCVSSVQETDVVDTVGKNISEAVPLWGSPPSFAIQIPTAPDMAVAENDKAMINYSNTEDGYVVVRHSADDQKKIKVIVDTLGGKRPIPLSYMTRKTIDRKSS